MKLTIGPFVLVAAVTALVCGCSDGGDDKSPSAPSVVIPTASAYPPVPSAADLNEELKRGFDPAVPSAEKAVFIQGAEEDPSLIDQVVSAAVTNDATVEITGVDDLGDGTLNAGATLTIGGQPNPTTMIFVAENGVWKLSRDNACALVGLAGLTSAACPAGE
ncbi:hypothetical protein BJD99_16035 [Rhodococcus sp. 1163]|uniref:hypothetical protein n=1 Tax=Rhodococcus sp. 1163 TaxID=1905289 RepID=UPI000A050FE7|nr:hypothetical protein [Rhodococcus sp. 1163]ORI12042.1 hypothetical protein BJD99_16035 [Rhodococcus sp. 1163]